MVVSTEGTRHLLPPRPDVGFSVETWACVESGLGSLRVAMASGRFQLGLDRHGRWRFVVYFLKPGSPVVRT